MYSLLKYNSKRYKSDTGFGYTCVKFTQVLCLWNWSVFGVWWKYCGCQKYLLQYGIRLCGVTEATVLPVSFDCAQEPISSNTVAVGTWQIPKLSAPFFCIHWKGGGELLVLNWRTNRVNYNCTGGWKAVEQKGFARCKESILHNLKL